MEALFVLSLVLVCSEAFILPHSDSHRKRRSDLYIFISTQSVNLKGDGGGKEKKSKCVKVIKENVISVSQGATNDGAAAAESKGAKSLGVGGWGTPEQRAGPAEHQSSPVSLRGEDHEQGARWLPVARLTVGADLHNSPSTTDLTPVSRLKDITP